MADTKPLKDHINPATIRQIAGVFTYAWPDFDCQGFIRSASNGITELELKQRIQHVITALHDVLPADFAAAAPILRRTGECWPGCKTAGWSDFAAWPVIDYVAAYGLGHPQLALPLLKSLTPLFTAEFALRPFLQEHFDLTYRHLQEWCLDEDEHVRRLVSEGSRPRLPWGMRLQALCKDPAPLLPLLQQLNNDPSAYVRKSVANHINDIAKDNPDIAIRTCREWQTGASPATAAIIRHALRSLVKAGHPQALAVLGFATQPAIHLDSFRVGKKRLQLGENLDFSFSIASAAGTAQKLVIDYAIHHRRSNGSTSAKVFKLKTCTLAPGATLAISKAHPIRPVTTRRYYTGRHRLDILVNGRVVASCDFHLTV